VSKRKRKPFKEGIYKITFSPGTPSEAVMTVAIELFLREIGLSTKRLEALGFEAGAIQVEVLRILLKETAEAYGLTADPTPAGG
jgi:hypothetical protein